MDRDHATSLSDNAHVPRFSGPRVLMLHKPKGVVVTRDDERGRKTVYDILPAWVLRDGYVPVGRLDRDSRGLLLFVQDGQLVERLTHPGHILKVYEVWIRGRVTDEHRQQALLGVESPVGTLRVLSIDVVGLAGPKTHLRVALDEGKNRHLRRLFGILRDTQFQTPLKVVDLMRVEFGPICLDIPSGGHRFLDAGEVARLLSIAG